MRRQIVHIILGTALLTGCVHVEVQPLTSEHFAPRASGDPLEELDVEPSQPHVKLARIIATTEYTDEDALHDKIVQYSRKLGAEAVVLGKVDVLEGPWRGSSYQSTLPADLQPTLFGGIGSGMPFFFDPWTFTQAPTDRVDRTLYRSGLAIRYRPNPDPNQL